MLARAPAVREARRAASVAARASTSRAASSSPSPSSAAAAPPPPRRIFSGIQPTGVPHLGNYLGALRSWLELQQADAAASAPEHAAAGAAASGPAGSTHVFFSIVGLHALTVPQAGKQLRRERRAMLRCLLAIGIDPARCTLFHQEQVPEHAELAWILNCLTSVGKLNRMTTWKGKLATLRGTDAAAGEPEMEQMNLGLYAYPVLQAADILLYRATHVPVGEDQLQHLELARDIAHGFNRQYKTSLFPAPAHIITPTKRVLSLRDPAQKMSKSAPDASSRLLLTDSPAEVRYKLKRAVTDSERELVYDPAERPGVSNLLLMLSSLRGTTPEHEVAALNAAGGGAGRLKEATTEAVVEALQPIQAALRRLDDDPGYVDEVERSGRERARAEARRTMAAVRQLVGFG